MTEKIASRLIELGAEIVDPPRSHPKLGYRFELEGETVELLGPDGLRADPQTAPGLTTFQAAGGSQALRRTEVVLVSLDGAAPIAVRRPDLLGAILIKVASWRSGARTSLPRTDRICFACSVTSKTRELWRVTWPRLSGRGSSASKRRSASTTPFWRTCLRPRLCSEPARPSSF
ncbi:MAG: hypothetical protein JSS68_00830 [Actinobacteria bacterium]|nr:hypothetical protein [Actinomycetota bacterium]